MAIQKDLVACIEFGELRVDLRAEGTPYNPDVLDDLVRRASDLWTNAVRIAIDTGLMDRAVLDEDEDEDVEDDESTKDDE